MTLPHQDCNQTTLCFMDLVSWPSRGTPVGAEFLLSLLIKLWKPFLCCWANHFHDLIGQSWFYFKWANFYLFWKTSNNSKEQMFIWKSKKVTVKWVDCLKIALSEKPSESREKFVVAARYNIIHISKEKMTILIPSLRFLLLAFAQLLSILWFTSFPEQPFGGGGGGVYVSVTVLEVA